MSDSMLERVLARDRWIVSGCLTLVIAIAWLWLFRQSVEMANNSTEASNMPDMDMGGAMSVSAVDAVPYLMSAFIMWLLMMIAMMLPAAAPMILLYSRLARGARAHAALASTTIFALVYLAIWAAFSLAAAIAQWLLIRTGFVSEMTLAFGNWRIGGALLMVAGLYQLTPLKRACLEACRSPMSFLMRLWRPNWTGAARIGLAHGLYCLGCCVLLMTLLFVFGVMNPAWVAALSLFVLIEKVLPFGSRIGLVGGVAAVGVGAIMVIY